MASTGSPLVSPGAGNGPRARRAMASTGSPLVSLPGAAARGVLGELVGPGVRAGPWEVAARAQRSCGGGVAVGFRERPRLLRPLEQGGWAGAAARGATLVSAACGHSSAPRSWVAAGLPSSPSVARSLEEVREADGEGAAPRPLADLRFRFRYGALAWICRAVSRRENRCCCLVGATCHSVIDFFCSRNKRVRKIARVTVGRRFKRSCLR